MRPKHKPSNQDKIQCVAWQLFFNDAEFNKYGDLKSVFNEFAPTIVKLAEKAKKHQSVSEYIAADGNNRYTGLNILW